MILYKIECRSCGYWTKADKTIIMHQGLTKCKECQYSGDSLITVFRIVNGPTGFEEMMDDTVFNLNAAEYRNERQRAEIKKQKQLENKDFLLRLINELLS